MREGGREDRKGGRDVEKEGEGREYTCIVVRGKRRERRSLKEKVKVNSNVYMNLRTGRVA